MSWLWTSFVRIFNEKWKQRFHWNFFLWSVRTWEGYSLLFCNYYSNLEWKSGPIKCRYGKSLDVIVFDFFSETCGSISIELLSLFYKCIRSLTIGYLELEFPFVNTIMPFYALGVCNSKMASLHSFYFYIIV